MQQETLLLQPPSVTLKPWATGVTCVHSLKIPRQDFSLSFLKIILTKRQMFAIAKHTKICCWWCPLQGKAVYLIPLCNGLKQCHGHSLLSCCFFCLFFSVVVVKPKANTQSTVIVCLLLMKCRQEDYTTTEASCFFWLMGWFFYYYFIFPLLWLLFCSWAHEHQAMETCHRCTARRSWWLRRTSLSSSSCLKHFRKPAWAPGWRNPQSKISSY